MNILNKVTVKYLYKNKVRTLVTIIGIILSAAMFSAVTTSISSFQQYMIDCVTSTEGAWHAAALGLDKEEQQALCDNEAVTDASVLVNHGFMEISSCFKNATEALTGRNDTKVYLMLASWEKMNLEIMPINLTEGRMPENATEVLVPKHLVTNGGIPLAIGDTITGAIGERIYAGVTLKAGDMYYDFATDENGNPLPDSTREELKLLTGNTTYTVVGFYERAQYCVEPYMCPGYMLLTGATGAKTLPVLSYQVYYQVENLSEIFEFIGKQGYDYDYHTDLLRAYGISEDAFQEVFWGMGTILGIIILFGSVALIYNAFSISVNERVRQFGLLSSIGATKRQLKKTVLFEAVCVAGIGIPLGVAAGIAGMAVTFYFLKDSFRGIVYGGNMELRVHVELWAIVLAAVLSFATVMISAWLPARRALKVSAIEAIRQNSELKCSRRKVRTFGAVYKLFGLEGMLANKNFKRNRRKYRATVISLFVSIVLFISASSFVSYLKKSIESVAVVNNFDYSYTLFENDLTNITLDELHEQLLALPEITRLSVIRQYYWDVVVDEKQLSEEAVQLLHKNGNSDMDYIPEENKIETRMSFAFLSDEEYRAYLAKQGLSGIGYFENEKEALVFDGIRVYNNGRYGTAYYLREKSGTLGIQRYKTQYIPGEESADEGTLQHILHEEKTLPYRVLETELPFGLGKSYTTFVYPLSALADFNIDLENSPLYLLMKSTGESGCEAAKRLLFANGLSEDRLYNYSESREFEKNLILIVNVFSYGFITLISLIAAANVFNTISTGISLRKREFAMLESVGMTRKGFYKMLNYECLLYGVKSLIYGLPVAVLVTWFIYHTINLGYEMAFYVPAASVAIAVISVFLVVFATMFYAASKLKKQSVIETLKNENV